MTSNHVFFCKLTYIHSVKNIVALKSQIKSKSSETPTADKDVCVFPIFDLYFWADSRRSEVQNCPVGAVP